MFECQGGRVQLHYCLTVLSGLLESLFFTGITFGWASLVFVLKMDGYFVGYCINATRAEDQYVSIETSVLLYPATACLVIAGTTLYITNVQVANLFDTYRSTIINVYNGAYDSSAAVFLIIKELDVKRNKDDKTAEAETSALHLLKKPLVEPKQEEGIVNKPCSHLL
ncbi:hypothetical protein KUCAC02_015129 [Chaenocephalus aceratus]|uniref:Uncharacterized protein n=1 Tax=Chaenocephalus aceratus TaxID=36190 RepID=A0ACB9XXY3_CHAAC|nr:hypothetical protein KUCAC02_015129 [Chaenocephalus aceratus]